MPGLHGGPGCHLARGLGAAGGFVRSGCLPGLGLACQALAPLVLATHRWPRVLLIAASSRPCPQWPQPLPSPRSPCTPPPVALRPPRPAPSTSRPLPQGLLWPPLTSSPGGWKRAPPRTVRRVRGPSGHAPGLWIVPARAGAPAGQAPGPSAWQAAGCGGAGGGDRPGLLPGAPRAAGPWCPPGAEAGARPSSVVLLLALHLSVFTMFGMLLFTGEEVLAALGAPARRGGPGPVLQGELCRGALGQRRWGQAGCLPASDQGQRRPAGSLVSFFKRPVSCRTRRAPVSPGLSLHPSRTGSLRLVLEVFGVTPPPVRLSPVHLPRQAPLTTSLVSSRGLCPLRLAPPSSPSLFPSPRQLAAVRTGLPPVTRPSVPALASPPRAAMVLRVSCPGRGHRPRV